MSGTMDEWTRDISGTKRMGERAWTRYCASSYPRQNKSVTGLRNNVTIQSGSVTLPIYGIGVCGSVCGTDIDSTHPCTRNTTDINVPLFLSLSQHQQSRASTIKFMADGSSQYTNAPKVDAVFDRWHEKQL